MPQSLVAVAIFLSRLLLVILAVQSADDTFYPEDCPRIRRPIHLLSTDELLLYVEGFQALRANGILDLITTTHAYKHHVGTHHGSSFVYWHSYLIWELETQIRNLGGKFECFSLPYWDLSIEGGQEASPFIFSTVLGNSGTHENLCVTDEYWSYKEESDNGFNYWVPGITKLCFEDETQPYCCLKRLKSTITLMPSAAELATLLVDSDTWTEFNEALITWHGAAHLFVGSRESQAPMHGKYATEDPIFFLLHGFIEYLRLAWSTCRDAGVSAEYFGENIYEPYCTMKIGCGAIKWTAVMDYFPMNKEEWSLTSRMDVRLEDIYNPTRWNVKYDMGTFVENAHLEHFCKDMMESDWFVSVDTGKKSQQKPAKTEQQEYIDDVWDELEDREDVGLHKKYQIADSLSCQFKRKISENSCWYEEMEDLAVETCTDRGIDDPSDLTLEDLLAFGGVKDNECLQEIRRTMFDSAHFFSSDVKLQICNGEFDYKCRETDYDLGIDRVDANQLLSIDGQSEVSLSLLPAVGRLSIALYVALVGLCCLCAMAYVYCICQPSKQTMPLLHLNGHLSEYATM